MFTDKATVCLNIQNPKLQIRLTQELPCRSTSPSSADCATHYNLQEQRVWANGLLGQTGYFTHPVAAASILLSIPDIRILPKSVWLLIHPMALRDTRASSPEPTKDPMPEKKKKSPMMALCMDLGAAE